MQSLGMEPLLRKTEVASDGSGHHVLANNASQRIIPATGPTPSFRVPSGTHLFFARL